MGPRREAWAGRARLKAAGGTYGMLILGIETSCDETAAAVARDGRQILASCVASQEPLHRRYGGVVPEIACRAHLQVTIPVVEEALHRAGLSQGDIDAVAVVNRPGLIGALLVGLSSAKTLAWALGLPLVAVNHLHSHLYAAVLGCEGFRFPSVGAVVSGGHTSIFYSTSATEHKLLGCTQDDAAGEAFDKVAKILGLGYPGGPAIDRLAARGDREAIAFPRSYLEPGSLDFSFSGVKTAVLYHCRGQDAREGSARELSESEKADIAASFQEAMVDVITDKLVEAARRHRVEWMAVGGGVACNSRLRARLAEEAEHRRMRLALPPAELCLDNAAVVAGVAHAQFAAGQVADLSVDAAARA